MPIHDITRKSTLTQSRTTKRTRIELQRRRRLSSSQHPTPPLLLPFFFIPIPTSKTPPSQESSKGRHKSTAQQDVRPLPPPHQNPPSEATPKVRPLRPPPPALPPALDSPSLLHGLIPPLARPQLLRLVPTPNQRILTNLPLEFSTSGNIHTKLQPNLHSKEIEAVESKSGAVCAFASSGAGEESDADG